MSLRRLLAPAVLTALVAALPAAPAVAASPAAASSTSAWVVNRQQGAIGTPVTPAAIDRGNSTGGTNTITRTGKGRYTVKLGGLTNGYGTVAVTPMSTSPRWCRASAWEVIGPDVVVQVVCADAAGADTNAGFVLTYTTGSGGHGTAAGRLAYAWSDDNDTPGTPEAVSQYTSAQTTIGITRTATGRYTLTLPAMGQVGGNVQVTPTDGVATCRAVAWAASGADEVVRVACDSPSGVAVDTRFNVLFLSKLGPEGFGGGPAAYLLATKPKATSSTPDATYRFNTKGKAMSILRGAVGNYTVILSGMPAGGAAIVTAYGTGTAHCQLSSLGTVVPMKAIVRCFTPAGAATNAKFSLAYAK